MQSLDRTQGRHGSDIKDDEEAVIPIHHRDAWTADVHHDERALEMHEREWLLKRNCCLAPRQLGIAYIVMCLMSFVVAAVFTMAGAWLVFAFAVMEMAVAAAAFLIYARHATDHEHIVLNEDFLLIKKVEAGKVCELRLEPSWTRVAVPHRTQDMITLEARGIKIEVGRFVTAAKRKQVAQELRAMMRTPIVSNARPSVGEASLTSTIG